MRTFDKIYHTIIIIGLSMYLAYWIAYLTDIAIVLLFATLLSLLSLALMIIDCVGTAMRRKKAKKRKKKKAPLV